MGQQAEGGSREGSAWAEEGHRGSHRPREEGVQGVAKLVEECLHVCVAQQADASPRRRRGEVAHQGYGLHTNTPTVQENTVGT